MVGIGIWLFGCLVVIWIWIVDCCRGIVIGIWIVVG